MTPSDATPASYGPVLDAWLAAAATAPLGVGDPAGADDLPRLDPATAFAHATVRDAEMAACCVAGMWLRYNELDRAHALCQDVGSRTGSYWHGVVHRREGDYGNAAYWFVRAAGHPAEGPIAEAIGADPSASEAVPGGWTPGAFVEACHAAVRRAGPAAEACHAAQAIEWRVLFAWNYAQAVRG